MYRDTAKPSHMDNMSDYCKKNVIKVFTDLVSNVDAKSLIIRILLIS